MKKGLLVSMALLVTIGGQAQNTTSPYTGSTAGSGEFYLYNVGTGKWLQNNDDNYEDFTDDKELWTTRAELGTRGLDFTLVGVGVDGTDSTFYINAKFNSTTINYSNLYLDTDDNSSVYIFEAVDVDGVPNAYHIIYNGGTSFPYLGAKANGWLALYENYTWGTNDDIWQLVTAEERMQYMQENATADNPVEASWLIGNPTFANHNQRDSRWSWEYSKGDLIKGIGVGEGGHDIVHANRVVEFWSVYNFNLSQVLNDIPNGTYQLSVDGYYRDGSTNDRDMVNYYAVNRLDSGTTELRAVYYANNTTHTFMSMLEDAKSSSGDGWYYNAWRSLADGTTEESGYYVPNTTGQASEAIFKGGYNNPAIKVAVAGHQLTIGARKDVGINDDWTIIDNFKLEYLGTDIDVDAVRADLQSAIDAASELTNLSSTTAINNQFETALANAKELVSNQAATATALGDAMTALNNASSLLKATAADATLLSRTIAVAEAQGVTGTEMDYAKTTMENAVSADTISTALSQLRVARKHFAADKQEDLYSGNEPAVGTEFYFYNLGTQRFLCGGESWGAHAAVGFPGVAMTLEDKGDGGYAINTDLQNGDGQYYLNYGGYCDTGGNDSWTFNSLGNGVYTISQTTSTNTNNLLGFQEGREVVVQTDREGSDNPDNQWKLVTAADRDALLANASEENPVDASYKIKMPGFSQREFVREGGWDNIDTGAWIHSGGGIENRGGNYDDFGFSAYNEGEVTLTQDINNLPEGYYLVGVQGYYRDGSMDNHIAKYQAGETINNVATLTAITDDDQGEYSQALPLMTDGIDQDPGYGTTTAIGEVPDVTTDALQYFQNGLYKTSMLVHVTSSGYLQIGMKKAAGAENDFVIVDNFRLTYLGAATPTNIDGVSVNTNTDNAPKRIYNLQGVQLKDMNQPGIYIVDGKKVIVK